ncbi:MAG TPA: hypothetical protein VEL07_08650 [Planctomycetota bacterium]|nr:hypothetical protein [Planctomycetota bacterium]
MSHRSGAVLIVISGIAAIVATLALGFLVRARDDADEGRALVVETQARLMLYAALQYVQEGARLGWDDPLTDEHEEGYGWIDIRDGRFGPCGRLGQPLWRPGAFPAQGAVARCPLTLLGRPPFAVGLEIANPMVLDAGLPWDQILGRTRPDPMPAVGDPVAFADGDPRPRRPSQSWFRVRRQSHAVFLLTCGAGPTLGLRDWDEVVVAGLQDAFGSEADFLSLRAGERLLWYEVEWSAAVSGNTMYHYNWADGPRHEYVIQRNGSPHVSHERLNSRQFGGTFSYIQRLRDEPPAW